MYCHCKKRRRNIIIAALQRYGDASRIKFEEVYVNGKKLGPRDGIESIPTPNLR